MKKFLKLGIVSGFLVAVTFLAFSNSAQATISAVETATSPRSLYVQNCARCHGSDGKSQTATGRKVDASDISGGTSASKTIRLVTNGKGKMPSFRRKLTAAQIASIAGYVQSL